MSARASGVLRNGDGRQHGKAGRHALIVREARAGGPLRVSALARRLGVSSETIRRDLDELSESGRLRRIYGGATLAPAVARPLPPAGDRAEAALARLGEAAAARIEPGATVALAGGACSEPLGWQLARRVAVGGFVTNAVGFAAAVGARIPGQVTLLPGTYDPQHDAVYGADTLEYVARFNTDVAVITSAALAEAGVSEPHGAAASLKRALLRRAARTLLIVEPAAQWRAAFHALCTFGDLCAVIAAAPPPPAVARACRHAGAELVVV